jgi:exodeoxyribonuclease-3
MRIVSWNVNGLKAATDRGAIASLRNFDADVICLSETKVMNVESYLTGFKGYHLNCANSAYPGKYGVAILSRERPVGVIRGISDKWFDKEGRTITVEFNDFYVVDVYVPFISAGYFTKEFCQRWHVSFHNFVKELMIKKDVIICGDYNVAHRLIDLSNKCVYGKRSTGSSKEEVAYMNELLGLGFIDTYRYQNPDAETYSWWPYSRNSRELNLGMRLDYFLITESLMYRLRRSDILTEVMGSDHCPIVLELGSKV